MTNDALAPPRLLPVWTVAKRSYAYAWESRDALLIPYILYAVATIGLDLLLQRIVVTGDGGAAWAVQLIQLVVGAAFAIGIMRFVLLGEIKRGVAFFRVGPNLARYVVSLVALFGLAAFLWLFVFILETNAAGGAAGGLDPPPGGLAALGGLALLIVGGVLILRLALALPAAALGEKSRFALAWRATRGNGMRVFAAAMLVLLPFLALDGALFGQYFAELGELARSGASDVQVPLPDTTLQLAWDLVLPFGLIAFTIMLSLTYDALVRGGGPKRMDFRI